MYEASFSGLIKTIFYIAVLYYAFKILARIFLPFLMKYFIKKAGSNFQQAQQKQQQAQQPHNEPIKEKKQPVGEYIDYEEID
jgi:hypothetical protein